MVTISTRGFDSSVHLQASLNFTLYISETISHKGMKKVQAFKQNILMKKNATKRTQNIPAPKQIFKTTTS